MRLRLSARADQDLTTLYERGLDDFGEAPADRYYDGLLEAFDRLCLHPRAARKRIVEGQVRLRRCGSHSIVYRIEDDGSIQIVRVLHGAQDLRRHLRA